MKLGITFKQTLIGSEGPVVSAVEFEYNPSPRPDATGPDISTAREVEAGGLQVQ